MKFIFKGDVISQVDPNIKKNNNQSNFQRQFQKLNVKRNKTNINEIDFPR